MDESGHYLVGVEEADNRLCLIYSVRTKLEAVIGGLRTCNHL